MPRNFIPHPYQIPMISYLRDNKRCGMWAPMGSGKSVCVLTALDDLDLVEDVFPALVLAPLRVAKTVWGPECEKWEHLNHLRTSVITGTAKERDKALDADAQIFSINYDNLVWLTESYGDSWPFKTVIADEFTKLKSFRLRQGSKRGRALGKVAFSKINRFMGLTGTPSPNGLKDLWGQTWFLDQGAALGRTFTAFQERWFQKGFDGYSIAPMPHAEKEIHERVRQLYITVEGLPVDEPIYNNVYIDLPPAVRTQYRTMEKEMFAKIREDGVSTIASNGAVKSGKLLQLSNGAVYVGDPDNHKEDGMWDEVHDEKLKALDDIIEEANGAPVLVAYHFRPDLKRLLKRYPNAKQLDANPQTIIDWNAGKIPILIAHPASCGHGLNLQDGGNILVFFGVSWNLEEYMQIIERIGPLRQKQSGYDRPVFVHHIVARGTLDLGVLDRLGGKKSIQDVLLEAMKRAA